MLTKDLLRYKIKSGQILPQFVNPTDAQLLAIAEQLIAIFEDAPNAPRAALLENSKHIIDSTPGPPIVKRGLEKLLLDRTEFDTAPNEELIAFRQKLFAETSRLLSQETFTDYADYQRRVVQITAGELPQGIGSVEERELAAKLYGDLPNSQPVLTLQNTLCRTAASPLQRRTGARVAPPL